MWQVLLSYVICMLENRNTENIQDQYNKNSQKAYWVTDLLFAKSHVHSLLRKQMRGLL